MPTAPKMIAAILFGLLGYAIYVAMVDVYGEKTVPGYLMALCVASGVLLGWRLCGAAATSIASGIGHGYTTIVAQAFVILAGLSFFTMIEQSLRNRYDGPMEGIVAVIAMIVENAGIFAVPQILILIGLGGFVAGAITGFVARRTGR